MRKIPKAALLLTLIIFAGFANAEVGPVKIDAPVRLQLLERATQGDANSQYNLGVIYTNGIGVPQDDKEAVKWYLLAAEQGYASAQYNLGLMYNNGEGVPQDHVMAYAWVNLAGANVP